MDQDEQRPMKIDHFLYKLISPRPTFPADMTELEAGVMAQHFGYWRNLLEEGIAVVYGPVADPAGMWGLAIVRADQEDDVRVVGTSDPAVSSGVATFEVFAMPDAIVGSLPSHANHD